MTGSDDEATKVIFHKTARDEQRTLILPDRKEAGPGGDDTVFRPAATSGQSDAEFDPVVGWVVVVDGPGRGKYRPIYYGQNAVGRGDDMRVRLDFGDQRISREPHAFLIYDDVERKYFLRDNGKANILRLNGNLVLAPSELRDRDKITIGQTTLLFVALCDVSFDWLEGHAPNPA